MKKIIILSLVVLVAGVSFFVKPKQKVIKKETFVADKTFEIKGLDYSYDVKEIKVKLNDKVKINFTNSGGFHDLKIDELGVDTGKIKVGESTLIEFVADKMGTFDYYCSVGQHRKNGMWGKIIVE